MSSRPEPTAERIEIELPPFQPPADFRFPPEFEAAIPRPVPEYVQRGRFMRRRRNVTITMIIVGVSLIPLSFLPMVQAMTYNFPWLDYLHWIGAGIAVIAILARVNQQMNPGLVRYITHGTPAIGRVIAPTVRGEINRGQIKEVFFDTAVEYHDTIGNCVSTNLVRAPNNGAMDSTHLSYNLNPGDYVTLVSLPEDFVGTQKIYSQLGLNPDDDSLLQKGKPISQMKAGPAILTAMTIIGCFGVLIFAFYSMDYYKFLHEGRGLVISALAGAFFAILAVCAGYRWFADSRPKDLGAVMALVAFIGALFIGAAFGIGMGSYLNAKFDRSTPQYKEATISGIWEEHHNGFMFRKASIKFDVLGGQSEVEYPTHPDRMTPYQEIPALVAEVGGGAFGWPWIRNVHPVTLEPQDDDWFGQGAVCIPLSKESKVAVFQLQYKDSEGVVHAASDQLRDLSLPHLVGVKNVGRAKEEIREQAEKHGTSSKNE